MAIFVKEKNRPHQWKRQQKLFVCVLMRHFVSVGSRGRSISDLSIEDCHAITKTYFSPDFDHPMTIGAFHTYCYWMASRKCAEYVQVFTPEFHKSQRVWSRVIEAIIAIADSSGIRLRLRAITDKGTGLTESKSKTRKRSQAKALIDRDLDPAKTTLLSPPPTPEKPEHKLAGSNATSSKTPQTPNLNKFRLSLSCPSPPNRACFHKSVQDVHVIDSPPSPSPRAIQSIVARNNTAAPQRLGYRAHNLKSNSLATPAGFRGGKYIDKDVSPPLSLDESKSGMQVYHHLVPLPLPVRLSLLAWDSTDTSFLDSLRQRLPKRFTGFLSCSESACGRRRFLLHRGLGIAQPMRITGTQSHIRSQGDLATVQRCLVQ